MQGYCGVISLNKPNLTAKTLGGGGGLENRYAHCCVTSAILENKNCFYARLNVAVGSGDQINKANKHVVCAEGEQNKQSEQTQKMINLAYLNQHTHACARAHAHTHTQTCWSMFAQLMQIDGEPCS